MIISFLRNKLRGLREIMYFDNWPILIISNIFFRTKGLQIYTKNGLQMIADKSRGDLQGLRYVISSPMYRDFLQYMHLPREVTILDIGANVGGFALMLHLHGHTPKKYVGVEMHPATFQRFSFNIRNNLAGEKILLNQAVLNGNGKISVGFTEGGTGESIHDIRGAGATSLETITLNRIIENHFGDKGGEICKIDIEGSEYEIFNGDECNLIKRFNFVLIEIHPHRTFSASDLCLVLRELGFSLVKEHEMVHLFQRV